MRYHTAILLSQGSTGDIYKAYDPVLERYVALKFLRRDDPSQVERMLREARAQARIEHEHICKVYEIGERDGRPYIAMQYIDGDELGAVAWRMTLEQKATVLRDVADALHAAHQRGLIHRDLKPANIMVEATDDGRWRPSVVDFGLVQEIEAPGTTRTGEVMGTPCYMAPEQARGEVRKIDRRTDVYGLGATLYELLVGRPPFVGGNTVEMLIQVLRDEPVPPRRLEPSLPADLETITLKCLEKDPERRYPSARALAADLAAYLEGAPIAARRPSLAYRLTKAARKHRALVTVSGVATVALLSLAGNTLNHRIELARQNRLVQSFASEGKDLEWVMRAEAMSPRHDVRATKARLRERIAAIERTLAESGRGSSAAAHYVLGQAHLVLYDNAAAREHLQQAWDLGYQTPEAAYALGLVLGRFYEQALARTDNLTDPELREARRRDVEQRFRDPAVRYLQASRNGETAAPEYVEGLLALYEKRFEEARRKARLALARLPWLYEARILVAASHLAEANELRNSGQLEAANEAYAEAERRFADAIAAAPSSAQALTGLCELRATIVQTQYRGPGGELPAALARTEEACFAATQVDGELASPKVALARAQQMYAAYLTWNEQDPTAALEAAVAHAESALAAEPGSVPALVSLGHAHLQQGERLIRNRRGDPSPWFAKALLNFEAALAAEPGDLMALNGLGGTLVHQANFRSRLGEDATELTERAVATLTRASAIVPKAYGPHFNLAGALRWRAQLAWERGEDIVELSRASNARLEQALAVRPGDGWALSLQSMNLFDQAVQAVATGADALPLLAQARTLQDRARAANPTLGWFLLRRAEIDALEARARFFAGLDPLPALRQAQSGLTQYLASTAEPLTGWLDGVQFELLEAEVSLASRRSPRPALARAEVYRERLRREAEPEDSLLPEAQIDRWLAEAELAEGRDPLPTIDRSLAAVAAFVALAPNHTEARAIEGELLVLQARTRRDPATRRQLAREAHRRFTEVFERNRWLRRFYEQSAAEAERLAELGVDQRPLD